MAEPIFRPALIVVDVQEDFCPPKGSLAVPGGLDIVPTVNKLLDLPFVIKIATQDWHPRDHVSFASNHEGKRPFVDQVATANPQNEHETCLTRLWPPHCIQGTTGAEMVAGVERSKVDEFIRKGQDARVEMYSPFFDSFTNPRGSDSGLAGLLKKKGVSHVYVVGLAADYCVKHAALDASKEGFQTFIVADGTKPVDPEGWPACKADIMGRGVKVIAMESPEVRRVASLSCEA